MEKYFKLSSTCISWFNRKFLLKHQNISRTIQTKEISLNMKISDSDKVIKVERILYKTSSKELK